MAKKVLVVVAPQNFRDEELAEPKKVFEDAGFEVTFASKGTKTATGMLGARQSIDIDVSEAKAADFDSVVFIGGSGAAVYFDDANVIGLAREAYDSGKVVGAICIAPSILANAGVLEGKKATAFSSERSNLEEKGATYTADLVTVDGKIVTGNGPEAAKKFGEEIAKLLR
jgi:protease I